MTWSNYRYVYRCPETCSCYGATVYCQPDRRARNRSLLSVPDAARQIDIHSNPDFYKGVDWATYTFRSLIHLNLSRCEVTVLLDSIFENTNNLRVLDLSYNKISTIPSFIFKSQNYLTELRLQGNSYVLSIEAQGFAGLSSAFKRLDLSGLQIGNVDQNAFSSLYLDILDISSSTVRTFAEHAFQGLDVKTLYLNGTQISWFSRDMFKGIVNVGYQFSDAYKFCCIAPTYLPEENCFPQKKLFSSCSDLIGNGVMRPLLWLIALIGLLCNGSTFIYRIRFDRAQLERGFSIFITNLAVSDFIMGVSVLNIVSVDAAVRGSYIFTDDTWRSSFLCKFIRVLSTLSCQASVTFLGFIAFDRLLVIKYPYGQIRLTRRSALVIITLVWLFTILFALFPFLGFGNSGESAPSPTSVCLSTVLSTHVPASYIVSVVLFIAIFFMTFCMVGYGVIFSQREMTLLRRALAGKEVSRTNDLKISRNLLLLGLLNVIIWCPVVVLGKDSFYSAETVKQKYGKRVMNRKLAATAATAVLLLLLPPVTALLLLPAVTEVLQQQYYGYCCQQQQQFYCSYETKAVTKE